MQKEFKTVKEQIEILKSRGLIIPDEDKAYKYLLSNNYYNIVNGYSKPFLSTKDKYLTGTTFDEVSHLYFFDKACKQTLFNAILDTETHLKSIFAYHFAQAHKHKPEAYLDVTSFNHHYSLDIAYTITKLKRIIKINTRYPNNSIYHYQRKYGEVPIWVLVDYLTFGDLYTLIKITPIHIQNKIAYDLTDFIKQNLPNFNATFHPATMLSFIKNIHELRNICAHNKRLIYFKCRSDCHYFEALHSKYDIQSNSERRDVYTTFISLQCFLSKTEYAKLHNTLRKRINGILCNHIQTIEINDILSLLGFPKNWYLQPKLRQN